MEVIVEVIPFFIGLFVPLALRFVMRPGWSSQRKFGVSFVGATIVGAAISLVMGELARDVPEAMMALIMDTSLVYTGSQLAQRLVWKPLFQARVNAAQTAQSR